MPKGTVAKRRTLAARKPKYTDSVFVNCPFDEEYDPIFHAIVFSIQDCGFVPRCALEYEDSGDVRIEKILTIIDRCKFGIHDISRTEPNEHGLPRFNMPLELGLFLGARRFGPAKKKITLVLDKERFRYQEFCSDIAGQDIQVHKKDPVEAIKAVRNWLRSHRPNVKIPGGTNIAKRYSAFEMELPKLKSASLLSDDKLAFIDYISLLTGWLEANAWKP